MTTGLAATCNWVIRWMRPNDLAIVFRLVSADPDSVWGPAELPKCLHSSDTAASVAECEGRIIGVIIYKVDRPFNELSVEGLSVTPAWRRQGVARSLLGSVLPKIAQGYDRLLAAVPETNLPAQLLFRACGFRAVHMIKNADGGDNRYLMELKRESTAPTAFA